MLKKNEIHLKTKKIGIYFTHQHQDVVDDQHDKYFYSIMKTVVCSSGVNQNHILRNISTQGFVSTLKKTNVI